MKVCIVTSDFVGPIRNGGIGTAYYALATTLAEAGHDVTVLYVLGNYCEEGSTSGWREAYRRRGICFEPLADPDGAVAEGPWGIRIAYSVYRWLKERSFDVVHLHEWRGHGFYALLAKRQGLAFGNTIFCVGTHSPYLWHKLSEGQFVDSLEDLELDFLERQSVALADVVISPSAYLLKWMAEQGWEVPASAIVRQNILPNGDFPESAPESIEPVGEVVFFGRLEARKGLGMFCDAIDRLVKAGSLREDVRVTFLGKSSRIAGRDSIAYLHDRCDHWPFRWGVVQDRDQAGALAFLRQPGRLAVIPSSIENSPYTVLECLGHGIPFLASRIGGIPELVDPRDAERVLFEPIPSALARLLERSVGSISAPARPAVPPEQTRLEWLGWHESLVPSAYAPQSDRSERPLVSICLVHFNRPSYLAQALDSLRAQDYPNIEVVLVDDGSTSPEALSFLQSLETEFLQRGWTLVRQENRYLGAARNAAARRARGEFLLFMDDDNVAKPQQISTFVDAAIASQADALTCFMDLFSGDRPPRSSQRTHTSIWLPLGGAAAVGVFRNAFGDANGLIRRDVFEAIGGFTEDYGLGHEDWELYARMVLAGFRLQVLPESLFWYRLSDGGMLRNTSMVANHLRSIRPYLERLPGDVRGMPLLAQGLYFRDVTVGEVAVDAAEEDAQQLVDLYWGSMSWRITAPLRNFRRRRRGLPPERKPQVASYVEALQVVNLIRDSVYWDLTGPLRVLRRMFSRLRAR